MTVLGYDAAEQLTAAVKQTTETTPTVLERFAYNYDPAGNRTGEQIDDALTGATYNAANQLVTQQTSGNLRFGGSLNEAGTVTVAAHPMAVATDHTFRGTAPVTAGTNTVTVKATDASGNTATQDYEVDVTGGAGSFTYDANGNLTSDGTRSFTWDAENRLLSVTIGTHVSEFTYDGESRRVRIVEKVGGSTTSDKRFVWCELEVCEERDASGAVVKQFFAFGVKDGSTNYFYTRDHLGSVRELSDDMAALAARYDYDPWGRRTRVSGTIDADFGFTNHYEHAPSSLTFALYRSYDSNLGRWLSEDPIGLLGGMNLYGYVAGDVIRDVDPLGLQNLTNQVGQPIRLKPSETGKPYEWLEDNQTKPGDGVVVDDQVVKTTDFVDLVITLDANGKMVATPEHPWWDALNNLWQDLTGGDRSGPQGNYHDWIKPGNHPDWTDTLHTDSCRAR